MPAVTDVSHDRQKLSKNAIFALHRGDLEGAEKQISGAESIAKDLLPTVEACASLRQGSFGSACEEYAEAKIFKVRARATSPLSVWESLPNLSRQRWSRCRST